MRGLRIVVLGGSPNVCLSRLSTTPPRAAAALIRNYPYQAAWVQATHHPRREPS